MELIKFVRSFKPDGADPHVDLDLVTFEDEKAYRRVHLLEPGWETKPNIVTS